MTKLSGTSAQTFSGLADSLNVRGPARGGKAAATKSQADGSFNDLLQTVSSLAKRALGDQAVETHVKTGSLHTHLAHPAEMDGVKGEQVGSEADPADQAATAEDDDEASGTQVKLVSHDRPLPEPAARVELADRPTIPLATGEPIAAAMPQPRSPAVPGRDVGAGRERLASVRRDDQMTVARAADAAAPDAAPETMHVRAASPGTAALPQEAGAPPKSPAAGAGFEAVTANLERATRVAVRDVLPEATKVTVVQQETHLPPAQFSAPQQVANALVAELKEVPASTASAAPDLAASQSGAPDQPLRILTISLEPAALGNVTVRLRLVGSEVSVHLAAERKDTSQMLDQQRESIRDLMQSAGYVADVAPVRHGSLDASPNGSGQSQPQLANQHQQPSSQSQGAFDGNGSSSRQSDDGARQARQERQPNQETRHDQDAAQQHRRGPVYL